MGWRLAEEVAWARPERPGPEWWTLMDLAQDARDATRQSAPGMDYLMARGKCGKRTILRRLEALREQKLILVVTKAAPGMKAVYEIGTLHELPGTGDSVRDTRSPVDNPPEHVSAFVTPEGTNGMPNGCHSNAVRVSETTPTGDSVRDTPPVTLPSVTPVKDDSSPADTSVEGNGSARGQDRFRYVGGRRMSDLEYAAWQVSQSRRERSAK